MELRSEARALERGPAFATWQERLDAASSGAEVVDIARDFIATVTPEETAQLPLECRPGKLVDAQDISDFAFTLVRRSCADDFLGDINLLRMATFFTRASLRLSQITAQQADAADQ